MTHKADSGHFYAVFTVHIFCLALSETGAYYEFDS